MPFSLVLTRGLATTFHMPAEICLSNSHLKFRMRTFVLNGAGLVNTLATWLSFITSVVKATGADVDESKIKSLTASLSGVDIDAELARAVVASAAAPAASGGNAPAGEEKAESAPKEEKKEAAAEGLSALFG